MDEIILRSQGREWRFQVSRWEIVRTYPADALFGAESYRIEVSADAIEMLAPPIQSTSHEEPIRMMEL